MTSKLALEFLCHRSSNFVKAACFSFTSGRLSHWWKYILASKSNCENTLPLYSNIICFSSSHREPTRTLVFFSHPPICPPLFNNQPLSFFSSRHVRSSQIAHGRSPICRSICPPSFSVSHIHCTCTLHLLCVWKRRSSLCLSKTFPRESLSLTPGLVLDVENSLP